MNCQMPEAFMGERAWGLKADSITGSRAISMGMPRFSTSSTMWKRYSRLRWTARSR